MDKRSANMTPSERGLLIDLCVKYNKYIDSKTSDTATVRMKEEAWKLLATEFQASSTAGIQRTWQNLKRAYENFKFRAKKAGSNDKVERLKTGGGLFVPQADDNDNKILAILGKRAKPLVNIYDGDADYNNESVLCFDNEEDPVQDGNETWIIVSESVDELTSPSPSLNLISMPSGSAVDASLSGAMFSSGPTITSTRTASASAAASCALPSHSISMMHQNIEKENWMAKSRTIGEIITRTSSSPSLRQNLIPMPSGSAVDASHSGAMFSSGPTITSTRAASCALPSHSNSMMHQNIPENLVRISPSSAVTTLTATTDNLVGRSRLSKPKPGFKVPHAEDRSSSLVASTSAANDFSAEAIAAAVGGKNIKQWSKTGKRKSPPNKGADASDKIAKLADTQIIYYNEKMELKRKQYDMSVQQHEMVISQHQMVAKEHELKMKVFEWQEKYYRAKVSRITED